MAWYPTLMNNTEPASEYKTMTVLLNLNTSDPTQWAVYDDDAMFMEAGSNEWDDFFGHYPCILDNGAELGKLNRNNFAQYEDGTSAPISTLGKDVMICFPRRGIKIEYIDNDNLSVSMTDGENVEGFSYMAHSYKSNPLDKFYLGAYKGYATSSRLYSTSGVTPTGNVTIGNFRTYAQARGTGYEQSGFFQLTFRQVMYLLKYKGQNAQIAVGRGFVDGNSSAHVTGGTNTRGMDWGESTGKDQMKLFGLEDFYGNVYEHLEGLWLDSSRKVYVVDGNFNNEGSGYIDAGTQSVSNDWDGCLRYPNGTNLAGFTPMNKAGGEATQFFCDRVYLSNLLPFYSGNWNAGGSAGVFLLYTNKPATSAQANTGTRLMYMHVAE